MDVFGGLKKQTKKKINMDDMLLKKKGGGGAKSPNCASTFQSGMPPNLGSEIMKITRKIKKKE